MEPNPKQAAEQLLKDARGESSLWLELGRGQYGFIHLQFLEYLAGLAIAQHTQTEAGKQETTDLLASHIDDPDWREVFLLAIGCMGVIKRSPLVAGDVLLQLLSRAPGTPGQMEALAGEAVADLSSGAGAGGVSADCRVRVVRSPGML